MKRFSLIELMVALAVVMILISLLVPSLAKSRATAHKAVCASQLKQLNILMQMYTGDNKAYYTFARSEPEGSNSHITWDDLLSPYLTKSQQRLSYNSNEQAWQESLYQCPSDYHENMLGFNTPKRSYAMSIGTPRGKEGLSNQSAWSSKVAQVIQASEVILLAEQTNGFNLRGRGQQSYLIYNDEADIWGMGVHGVSEKRLFSFADGHINYFNEELFPSMRFND